MALVDVTGQQFRRLVEDVESLAGRELRSTSTLARGLAALSGRGDGVLDEQDGSIARSLDELRRWARDLAPPSSGVARARRRFGIFPARESARDYQELWARAQQSIDATVARLREAMSGLRAANAGLQETQLALHTEIATLTRYAEMAEQLDQRLSAHIDSISQADPQRAAVLRRELLVEVRRRRQEILTQVAVGAQGGAALRIIEESNRELIDAVTSATSGILVVVQTGAAARQALEMRRRLQTGRAARAAALPDRRSVVEAEALQRAWADVGETLNEVERLRRLVLESAATLARSDLRSG